MINDKLPEKNEFYQGAHGEAHDKFSTGAVSRTQTEVANILDEQWLSLSQDWQSQPYEKTDIQALLKQTKKRTLLALSLIHI